MKLKLFCILFIFLFSSCSILDVKPKEEEPEDNTGSGVNTGGTTQGASTGKVTFWVSGDYGVGQIKIYIGGIHRFNIVTFHTTAPTCGSVNTITLSPGTYSFEAISDSGTKWTGNVIITAGGCNLMLLQKPATGNSSGTTSGGNTGTSGTTTTNYSKIIFYTTTNVYGPIEVNVISGYVGGGSRGTITHYVTNGVRPACGVAGFVTVNSLKGNEVYWEAKSTDGKYSWKGNVKTTNEDCFAIGIPY